jgi:signal transduction histidine kinase
MKLSLTGKCIILIAVPVCFELTLFTILLDIHNSTAAEAARVNRAQLIATTINKVCLDSLWLEDSLTYETRPMVAANNIDHGMTKLIGHFRLLDTLTTDYPALNRNIKKDLFELEQASKDLDSLKKAVLLNPDSDPTLTAINFRPTFKRHIRRIAYGGTFDLAPKIASEFDADTREKARQITINLLHAAVGVSILLAGLSALFLSRSLTSRIKVLTGNASLIGARKPLSPPISGSDEIAVLDKAMHRASDLIHSLERAREEIISMVGHDIRSPITTIRCAGETLHMKLEDKLDEGSSNILKEIDSNCDRILRISKDLLDMQRLNAGSLTLDLALCNLGDCLREAVSAVQGLCQSRNVEIEIQCPSISAVLDESRIEQVIVNLLSNAIKFSPEHSTVVLEAQTSPNTIVITVTDHGPGIKESMMESIFEPFVQVNENDSKKGSGLGLAIAKALVELHQGSLSCTNAPSGGCVFSVILPWRK